MDKDLGSLKSIILIIAVTIICLLILNIPEKTGIADNGDFARVLEPTSLTSINPNNAKYFYQSEYIMDITNNTFFEALIEIWQENIYQNIDYSSSQLFFINIAKTSNYIFNIIFDLDPTHFSMFFLDIQYILIFAFAFWLLYKSFRTGNLIKNILILIVLSFVFLDLGYIIYFNSMYGEALQYCSFMLITSILLYTVQCFKQGERLTSSNFILLAVFFIFTFVFATAKTANIPIGIIFAITGIIITLLTAKNISKILLIILGCASIVLSIIQLIQIPAWMTNVANYNTVFYGVLKRSNEPKNDLAELNINGRYVTYTNTIAYNPLNKYSIYTNDYSESIYKDIANINIVRYYFINPGRFIEKTNISLNEAKNLKPAYLGNYEEFNHNQGDVNNNFSLWSNIRGSINITTPGLFILICILVACYITINLIKYLKRIFKDNLPHEILLYDTSILNTLIYLTLFISMLLSLVIPFMANGEAELQKHLFLFNNIYDIIFIIIICTFVINIDIYYSYIKEKIIKAISSH